MEVGYKSLHENCMVSALVESLDVPHLRQNPPVRHNSDIICWSSSFYSSVESAENVNGYVTISGIVEHLIMLCLELNVITHNHKTYSS